MGRDSLTKPAGKVASQTVSFPEEREPCLGSRKLTRRTVEYRGRLSASVGRNKLTPAHISLPGRPQSLCGEMSPAVGKVELLAAQISLSPATEAYGAVRTRTLASVSSRSNGPESVAPDKILVEVGPDLSRELSLGVGAARELSVASRATDAHQRLSRFLAAIGADRQGIPQPSVISRDLRNRGTRSPRSCDSVTTAQCRRSTPSPTGASHSSPVQATSALPRRRMRSSGRALPVDLRLS